ncbi:MAG: phosphoglycerate mutase [Gammaproteobacteria bacterium]|nr:phosphoglycerate mutase [Gammaproteobacteria bacterium]TVQ47946.1 MAG: phosphoglycerate mutase [Gammaproteobacteria bacterium]
MKDDRLPIVLVILDGLGDRACPELGGRTPCEAADTPVLDRLVSQGMSAVHVPFGPGRATSSEFAHWSLFGFQRIAFPGRAAIEALGVGQSPPVATPLFHLALRAGEPRDGALWLGARARRGHDEADAAALFEALAGRTREGVRFELLALRTGECVLAAHGAGTRAVSDTDALFDHLHPWMRPTALADAPDEAAAHAFARTLEHWLLESREMLIAHPVNRRRQREGLVPLDVAVTKWASWIDPEAPCFQAHTGLRGGAVTDTALYRGLARLLDMRGADLAYDSRDPGGDMRTRLAMAGDLLADCDFVHVHVKATDEAGHTKRPAFKQAVIEAIDAGLEPLLSLADHAIVAVTGDHATPSVGALLHSGDPTPFVVAGPGVRADGIRSFGECHALGGAGGRLAADDVLPLLAGLSNQPFFLGHRPGARETIALPRAPEPMPVL